MKAIARLMIALAAVAAGGGLGAGEFKNPILHMDFSDPDVCVGHDGRFYMTASSFGGLPGLPILASDDLVNWRYVAYALEDHPFNTCGPEHGNSVWAPSIRYRADKDEYVIYWGDPDRGAYRVSAPRPEGPWSEPRLVVPAKGLIDTCPLYDDDGRVYLVNGWANSRAGMNSVLTVRELDAEETKAISAPVMVYDGVPAGNFTAEGPKFYKKDGEYWVFFPAGGVGGGWQVAMRGKTPYGPFEARTVMAQGNSKINGPHQGGWVQEKDGSYWFMHFSDRDAYGRIVYLQPMAWREDGWPVIGADPDGDGCGEPLEEVEKGNLDAEPSYPQLDDEFDTPVPGLQWQFLGKGANIAAWGTPYGYFRIYSTPYGYFKKASSGSLSYGKSKKGKDAPKPVDREGNMWNMPNLMVQKFPALAFTATMKAQCGAKQPGEESGIVVQGRSYARLGLEFVEDDDKKLFRVVYTECINADKGKNESKPLVLETIPAKVIGAGLRTANVADAMFRVAVAPGEVPPKGLAPAAVCTFSYSLDGGETWKTCPKTFTAREGQWIGATVGVYATNLPGSIDRGWIDIDYFRIAREQ